MATHIQFVRNSSLTSTYQDAITNLQTYINENVVEDGEILFARYNDNNVAKTVMGAVCIYNNQKFLSLFTPSDTILVN